MMCAGTAPGVTGSDKSTNCLTKLLPKTADRCVDRHDLPNLWSPRLVIDVQDESFGERLRCRLVALLAQVVDATPAGG